MPGQPGNYVTYAFGRQSGGKGVAQATPAIKTRVTGGFIRPERVIVELEETDSSRQASESVVVGSRAGGTPTHYLRSDEEGFWAYCAMGAIASGAGLHTLTSTGAAPYVTAYEAYGSTVLVNRYIDLRLVRHTIRGAVGGVFTVENDWRGISAQFGQADPAGAANSLTPLTWPNVTVTKGGTTADVISEVELTVDNGGEYIEGDVGMEPIDYVFGRFTVSGQITVLFEDDDHFREFHGGSAAAVVPGETLFAEDLTVDIQRSATDRVRWVMTQVQYQTYDLQPNPAGNAIRVPMAFRAKPQPAIEDTLTILVNNAVGSY